MITAPHTLPLLTLKSFLKQFLLELNIFNIHVSSILCHQTCFARAGKLNRSTDCWRSHQPTSVLDTSFFGKWKSKVSYQFHITKTPTANLCVQCHCQCIILRISCIGTSIIGQTVSHDKRNETSILWPVTSSNVSNNALFRLIPYSFDIQCIV